MGAPRREGLISVEDMISLYESGKSLNDISEKAKLSPATIMHRLKEREIPLRSNTAPRKLVGEEYLGSDGRYWVRGPQNQEGKARNKKRARVVMESLLGEPIPEGYSVHHIDQDYTNDSPENLQLISNTEHLPSLHNNDLSLITRHYKNFNDAFLGINRDIMKKPRMFINALNTTMGMVKPMMINCETSQCDQIDLGALGYKPGKWSHLVKTYLGPEKIEELKHLGENCGGLSVGFDFLRKTTHNGACMREIIISRHKRKKPWDTINVFWRTTELQRRWAADLILISRIMELIPNSDFKEIHLWLPTSYQSAMYIIPLVTPVFGMRIEDLDPNHFYTKVIITREKKYYIPDTCPHNMLSSGEKVVELYKAYQRGDKLPKITYKECKL